jgi:hypothetical protein
MKGKITKQGWLQIERAGKFIDQECPFVNSSADGTKCGQWCPHFGEPENEEYVSNDFKTNKQIVETITTLGTCRWKLFFKSLIDERKESDNEANHA